MTRLRWPRVGPAGGPASAPPGPSAGGGPWLPAALSTIWDGGRVAEDQAGGAFWVRLECESAPGAAVDVAAYATRVPSRSRLVYRVDLRVVWLTAGEAAGERTYPLPGVYGDWAYAEEAAAALAGWIADGGGRSPLTRTLGTAVADPIFDWDGKPFRERN